MCVDRVLFHFTRDMAGWKGALYALELRIGNVFNRVSLLPLFFRIQFRGNRISESYFECPYPNAPQPHFRFGFPIPPGNLGTWCDVIVSRFHLSAHICDFGCLSATTVVGIGAN